MQIKCVAWRVVCVVYYVFVLLYFVCDEYCFISWNEIMAGCVWQQNNTFFHHAPAKRKENVMCVIHMPNKLEYVYLIMLLLHFFRVSPHHDRNTCWIATFFSL